ncbi:MAG: MFS transporter [Wenzhouxiangellaceae bacterium]|nr:MFS transporter [Wenzhouxiangellaceae bacterium]
MTGPETAREPPHRWLLIASLALAGESIYMLPYLRKSFQTSIEAVFGLSSFQVGMLNALFGILALLCYLPGGWLADRVSARRLLTVSLTATALGGAYMASLPSYPGLLAVHAFWGVSTIVTFWAALIKATRLWSPPNAQGRAFGVLDGGRGIVGAGLGSLAALGFGMAGSVATGLMTVILIYSGACLVASAAVWLLVPDDHEKVEWRPDGARGTGRASGGQDLHVFDAVGRTLRIPEVWLIALVILCAYFSFLGTYEFPAYAERGFDQSKEFGAWLGAFRDWFRPLAAIGAGILADRISAARTTAGAFALLLIAYLSLFMLPPDRASLPLLLAQVVAAALAVFALRGIYFALFEEVRIPLHLTGIAVGFVSMVGYTPDIFAPVLAGWLADHWPGASGYRIYFVILAGAAAVGMVAATALHRRPVASGHDSGH